MTEGEESKTHSRRASELQTTSPECRLFLTYTTVILPELLRKEMDDTFPTCPKFVVRLCTHERKPTLKTKMAA